MSRVLVAVLSACVACSAAYTLRNSRRQPQPWVDNHQLEEALKVIQERRRLIDDEPLGYGDSGFDEADEESALPWEQDRAYMDPNAITYIRDMIYGNEDRVAEGNEGSTSQVDERELEDILNDEDDEAEEEEDKEEDKRVPPDLHKKEYNPSSIVKKEVTGGEIQSDELTPNEIKEIMEDEAEDAMKGSLKEQEQQEGEEAVSADELQDVFTQEEEEAAAEDAGGADDDDDKLFPNIIAKEVALNKESYDDSAPSYAFTAKRKRKRGAVSLGDAEAAAAAARLQQAVAPPGDDDDTDDSDSAKEYIRQFLALEDDENTNLANALNLATLAQVQKTDKYIPREADYIKRAIEDEQAIQLLKDELEETSKSVDRKRSHPMIVPRRFEPEVEQPEVETDDREEGDALHRYMTNRLRQYLFRTSGTGQPVEGTGDELSWLEDDEDETEDEGSTLNPFLRELMQRYYAGNLAKRAPPKAEEFEPEFEEEEEEEEDAATRAEIATVLQAYVQELTPVQRVLLKEAVKEKLEELEEEEAEEELANELEEEEGYCPAIDVLDDCAAARDAGLDLDMEALYMCNRHQMCYTCGSSHGLSAAQCDRGYRAEADRLCDKELDPERCRDDSNILLLDMVQEHVWRPFSEAPPVCSENCAVEYILGVDKKK